MLKQQNQNGLTWLACGVVVGLCLSYVLPRERVMAVATDRNDQFAMATCTVSAIAGQEGIFVIDFLTGQLKGAVLNKSNGKFTQFYYRNLAQDFKIDPTAEPRFAFVTGRANLPSARGIQIGASVLYIAELSSGTVACYGYDYRESPKVEPPKELIPIDRFPFRKSLVN